MFENPRINWRLTIAIIIVILIAFGAFYAKKLEGSECLRRMKLLEMNDDLYQDAATDKQWKEYINNKYHFDPPVCSNYSEN